MATFFNTTSESNYRSKAIIRIDKTPSIKKSFGHLKGLGWADNHPIWKWLAEASVSSILAEEKNFTASELKMLAYHEAGHAVVCALNFMDIVSATSVPDPANHLAGEVIFEAEIPNTKSFYNMNFWAWRLAVQLLAGPASQEMFRGRLEPGFYDDIRKAISYIQQTIPDEHQKHWLELCLAGVSLTILRPNVWAVVEEVAKLLHYHGTVAPSVINDIVSKRVLKVRNPSSLVKSLKKFQEDMVVFDGNDALANAAENINLFFMNEIVRLTSGKIEIGRDLGSLVNDPLYWIPPTKTFRKTAYLKGFAMPFNYEGREYISRPS